MNLLARLFLASGVLIVIVLVAWSGSVQAVLALPVVLAAGAAFIERVVGRGDEGRG